MRRFWRGDALTAADFATRLTGSSDLYLRDGRKPFHSINFVTSHDGFTLNDLVSYTRKHNEANGEGNEDGHNQNYSANYGVEGPTDDQEIEGVRNRQVKNFFLTLFLSLGTPMMLGGDELRRTQGGNNNAYCQNNETSWIDWAFRQTHADILRFCRLLIAFRRSHPAFHRPEFYSGKDRNRNSIPDITWFDEKGREMQWGKADRLLAYRLDGSRAEIDADRDDNDFFLMFNALEQPKEFVLCAAPKGKSWYLAVDTSLPSPEDFLHPGHERLLPVQKRYTLQARSAAVLLAK